MAETPIQIKRYPNRRYYSRNTSQYVSLSEIEDMVQSGQTVEIRDSQSGEDLTRTVLTQIIVERQPEKMSLFPADMLHFIVRSNDAMSDFLRDYFRQSLTYLDYLQRHSTATPLTQPMHWMKAWLDGISPKATPPSEGGRRCRIRRTANSNSACMSWRRGFANSKCSRRKNKSPAGERSLARASTDGRPGGNARLPPPSSLRATQADASRHRPTVRR